MRDSNVLPGFDPKKLYQVYCSDGPLKGHVFTCQIKARKIYLPLTSNSMYNVAVYLVSTTKNNLGEFIAVFSFAKKRPSYV